MSLSIVFQEPDDKTVCTYQLASAHGWKLIGEWAETVLCLPLRQLVNEGKRQDTFSLVRAIRSSVNKHPPDNDEVRHTLERLIEMIGVGSPEETATVTGG